MSTDFTKQDLDLMFEAVEAWEREDKGPGIMGAMMGAMFGKDDPKARAKFDAEMETKQAEADAEKRRRKERGCLLRAKLITLRDKADAEEFVASV